VKRYERTKKQVVNANKRIVAEKKRSEVQIQKNTFLQKEIEVLRRQLDMQNKD
jgi:hypothetical protein